MHNTIFTQIYASAVWEERLALSLSGTLIFPAFAWLFLPHVGLSRSRRAVAGFPCLAMVSELFCRAVGAGPAAAGPIFGTFSNIKYRTNYRKTNKDILENNCVKNDFRVCQGELDLR